MTPFSSDELIWHIRSEFPFVLGSSQTMTNTTGTKHSDAKEMPFGDSEDQFTSGRWSAFGEKRTVMWRERHDWSPNYPAAAHRGDLPERNGLKELTPWEHYLTGFTVTCQSKTEVMVKNKNTGFKRKIIIQKWLGKTHENQSLCN